MSAATRAVDGAWLTGLVSARQRRDLSATTAAAIYRDLDERLAAAAPFIEGAGMWLPVLGHDTVDELELVTFMAVAVRDHDEGRLPSDRAAVLDLLTPGWRDPEVRRWLGVTA